MSYHSKYKDKLVSRAKSDVAECLINHVVTQRHRDGDPGRIWRCARPGTVVYAFTVYATPGWLMMTGDIGECMWSRVYDMLSFIRGSIGSLEYFSEKASRDCVIREKRTELAEEWLDEQPKEWKEYHGEPMTKEQKAKLREIRDEFEEYNSIDRLQTAIYDSQMFDSTSYIPSCEFYTFQYLWKIEALKWFIAKVDSGDVVKDVATFESKDLYLVQNKTAGYVGNSPMWWSADDCGYTPWVGDAKRFSIEEANALVDSLKGSHDLDVWPLSHVLQNSQLTVDIQKLRK